MLIILRDATCFKGCKKKISDIRKENEESLIGFHVSS